MVHHLSHLDPQLLKVVRYCHCLQGHPDQSGRQKVPRLPDSLSGRHPRLKRKRLLENLWFDPNPWHRPYPRQGNPSRGIGRTAATARSLSASSLDSDPGPTTHQHPGPHCQASEGDQHCHLPRGQSQTRLYWHEESQYRNVSLRAVIDDAPATYLSRQAELPKAYITSFIASITALETQEVTPTALRAWKRDIQHQDSSVSAAIQCKECTAEHRINYRMHFGLPAHGCTLQVQPLGFGMLSSHLGFS